MAASSQSLHERIAYGYRLTTSRSITSDRAKELADLHQRLVADYTANQEEMKKIASTPEDAALAVLASVLLNLDESFTR